MQSLLCEFKYLEPQIINYQYAFNLVSVFSPCLAFHIASRLYIQTCNWYCKINNFAYIHTLTDMVLTPSNQNLKLKNLQSTYYYICKHGEKQLKFISSHFSKRILQTFIVDCIKKSVEGSFLSALSFILKYAILYFGAPFRSSNNTSSRWYSPN